MEYYDKAIKYDDTLHQAYYNAGVVLCALKKYDKALKYYDKAINLSSNQLYLCQRAELYNSLNSESLALEDLKKAYTLVQSSDDNELLSKDNKIAVYTTMLKHHKKIFEGIDSAIDSVEEKLLASNIDAEDKKQVSKIVDQVKVIVEEKKQALEHDVVLNQVVSKQAVQEDIIKALVGHAKTDKQTLDLHMNFIMELKQELGMVTKNITTNKLSPSEVTVTANDPMNEPLIKDEKNTQQVTKENRGCCKSLQETCIIFSIPEIKYDNPILNYPEVIRTLTKDLSLNFLEVVDKVGSFDRDFVREFCLSGNVELLQECFELN